MDDALVERVDALERAVTDGDHDLSALADDAAALDRLDAVEERIDEIADRVDELEAATQALRGYVGNIRSVNQDVEKRADAALAKAESLEAAMADSAVGNYGRKADPNADEGRSRSRHQADDSGRGRRQPGRTETEPTAATPDGGHSTSSVGESDPGKQRCHACGQSRSSERRERGDDVTEKRKRNNEVPDSLAARSVLDGNGVAEQESIWDRETPGRREGRNASSDNEHGALFEETDHEKEDQNLVPESDPLVSDDDKTGGLRRLRELL